MDNNFSIGDKVVYPLHGLGVITEFDIHRLGQEKLEMMVIYFEHEKLKLRVPKHKVMERGIRKISSKEHMKTVVDTLKMRPKTKRFIWNKRVQEYSDKINSGDPISIAEVVRDLFRSPSELTQSFSERQIYQTALSRLAMEYAAVESIDKKHAEKRLVSNLAR